MISVSRGDKFDAAEGMVCVTRRFLVLGSWEQPDVTPNPADSRNNIL